MASQRLEVHGQQTCRWRTLDRDRDAAEFDVTATRPRHLLYLKLPPFNIIIIIIIINYLSLVTMIVDWTRIPYDGNDGCIVVPPTIRGVCAL